MRNQIKLSVAVGLCIPLLILSHVPAMAATPTSAYKEQKRAGFTILVHPKCFEQPNDTAAKALDLLEFKLQEVNRLLPEKQLAILQKVRL